MDDIDYDMHDEADWLERQDFESDPDTEREDAFTRSGEYAEQLIFEAEYLANEGKPHPNSVLDEHWCSGQASWSYVAAKRAEWAAR